MSIRLKIITVFLILAIPSMVIGHLAVSQLSEIAKPIKQEIPRLTQDLIKVSEMERLSQYIRYYDEVLTQAARNFVFTKKTKWREIYNQSAVKLDETIKKATEMGDYQDDQYFQEIDSANTALIKMEEESMNLVDKNRQQEAIGILEGEKYWQQKEIYKSGLTKFIERRGMQYDQALITSTEGLNIVTKKTEDLITYSRGITISVVIISVITAVFFGIVVAYLVTKPITLLKKTVLEISRGEVQKRAEIDTKDEIGELAYSFNEMADKLLETQANIEKKVAERTADLEKINKHMVGREIKMMELKKQLKQIQTELNKNKKK